MQIPCLHVADIELPREVARLYELAYNFWWAWTPMARRLFSSIDSVAWTLYRNPVEMLINVEPARWEPLLESETFMTTYNHVIAEFDSYMSDEDPSWFDGRFGAERGPVAYFCMEFGVHESVQGYSGGLGVLAGDHLKGASDLRVPLVGVGLLYRRGYFRQAVDADGHQQHIYPVLDFSRLPLRPAAGPTGRSVVIKVDMPGREVFAKVWVAQVGRVPLLLLDTDIVQNDPADRPMSGILYVRGRDMRLTQEFFLGVGGVRALDELGIRPAVWHLNEGHSAFLLFERLRDLMKGEGLTLDQARDRVRATTVFTTHTPVPAGNETFNREAVSRYLEGLAADTGVGVDALLAWGEAEPGNTHAPFNLTACALRSSRFANGVSRIHGQVSNDMWRHLPEVGETRPITSVTNGVHTDTWLGMAMLDLFNRTLGRSWKARLSEEEGWELIESIADDELWEAHREQKTRLARFIRASLLNQFARHGRSPDELRKLRTWFSVDALTIGFARRFATYKRAHLLFSDIERIRRLTADGARPLQIVLAGKAHPADRPGQELVQYLFGLTRSPELQGKVFFLENYNMSVARAMLRGVDVWLNTPRRPQEASGTSGMKAAINGALNLSVLDGWWPEAYDGNNGWAIGPASPEGGDEAADDQRDADSLYALLEDEILPTYYDRDERGIPVRWVQRMKHSIAGIMPRFSARRMVREYAEKAYFIDG